MTARIPKKSIQNAPLVKKQTTRRNGVGKAPELPLTQKPHIGGLYN